MKKFTLKRSIALALVVAGVGCGGSSDDTSRVRVFHASPDAPNVDVLVDGGRVLENVPYPAASDFLEVSSGHRQLSVTPAGDSTRVIDARVDLEGGVSYLVIASGKVASIAPLVAPVDGEDVPSGSVRVRVLHTAPSAPNVDVYVVGNGASIQNAEPVLSNVPFGAISQYLTVPVGKYDVFVTVAGTKTVAIEATGLDLVEGFRGSVAALDAKGGGAPFALQILDESAE
jgi:hypothetical protein